MRHYYIRHAEHAGDTLTATGLNEARSLHERLLKFEPSLKHDNTQHNFEQRPRTDEVQAWSADTFRSLATTALALRPSMEDANIPGSVESLMRSGVLHADPALRYTKFSQDDGKIREAYQSAYEQGRTMEFYIRHSDEFLKLNPKLSTHSTLAAELARRTLSAKNDDAPGILCAREFFWPNFRAAILSAQGRVGDCDRYVDWYCNEKELNPTARTDIARVFTDSRHTLLDDDYGTLACNEADLHKVIQKGVDSVKY